MQRKEKSFIALSKFLRSVIPPFGEIRDKFSFGICNSTVNDNNSKSTSNMVTRWIFFKFTRPSKFSVIKLRFDQFGEKLFDDIVHRHTFGIASHRRPE